MAFPVSHHTNNGSKSPDSSTDLTCRSKLRSNPLMIESLCSHRFLLVSSCLPGPVCDLSCPCCDPVDPLPLPSPPPLPLIRHPEISCPIRAIPDAADRLRRRCPSSASPVRPHPVARRHSARKAACRLPASWIPVEGKCWDLVPEGRTVF